MEKEDVIKRIEEYFSSNELKFKFEKERSVFIYELSLGKESMYEGVREFLRVADDYVICHCKLPIKASRNIKGAAEYLSRANYGLIWGNFELDFEDGEIRYKLTTDISDVSSCSDDMIERIMFLPASMVQQYIDGLSAVISGTETPAKAIEDAERNS